jgi:transcriptional regulator GlxA family with amidase domain
MTALLLTQPHDWSHVLYAAAPAAPADAVAQAVERIEAQPALAWTTARLAADAGVSARTLQEGFRRAHAMTPTEYVREARLRRAHRDLTDPARAGESVTEIATAAGFTHLGRFADAYRRKHGLHPSVVLRTTRAVAEAPGARWDSKLQGARAARRSRRTPELREQPGPAA